MGAIDGRVAFLGACVPFPLVSRSVLYRCLVQRVLYATTVAVSRNIFRVFSECNIRCYIRLLRYRRMVATGARI